MELSESETNLMKEIPSLSMSLGIVKSIYPKGETLLDHMPVSLYPYKIKLSTYFHLQDLNYIWHKLFVKLAADKEFINELANKFCHGDLYT